MTPYPAIERWRIPAAACVATLDGVAARPGGREAGAFWLGRRAGLAEVQSVVLPHGEGVEERPHLWRVGADVYGAITRWASASGATLLAIAHTHVGPSTALSRADQIRSVLVPGILALVLGRGGADHEPAGWGWYLCDGRRYRPIGASERRRRIEVVDGPVEVWEADRHGVRQLEQARVGM